MVIRNLKEICLKGVQPERNPEQRTAEETPLHTDKASVIRKEVDKPTGQTDSKPSIDNRRLFLKGKRTPKQCNVASCMPTNTLQGSCGINTRIAIGSVDETQQDDPFKLLMGFNEVTPFSNEFSTVERDIERLLVDLDSKTRSAVESQRKNTSSSEKVLKLKLNDSKSADHENQIILCNNNGFIDSITVEVKLNKEKLMNEFANGNIFDARQLQKEVKASVKATEVGKDTTVTNKERFVPERLKQHSQHKLQEQTLGEQGDSVGKQNVDLLTCEGTNSYGTVFAKQRRIATDRWISDLFKSIGAMEKIRELTENGQKKNEDVSRKKGSQVQETDLVGPFSNRPLHEPPVELLMNKQIVSKRTACQNSSQITSSQSVKKGKGNFQSENYSLGTTERPVKTVPFGHKGQQRRAERDVRLALWQEKNERLRDINSELINHKDIEDGFVGKIGDKLLRSSRFIKEKDFKVIALF